MENLPTISQRLTYLIKEKGITQYQLSSSTGITEGSLSKIISGKTKKLRESTLKILANYFEVSEDWLRTGIEKESNRTTENKAQEANNAMERLIAANESLAASNKILAENNARLIMYLEKKQ